MQVKCLAQYDNGPRGFYFQAGIVYEMTEAEYAYLNADSPESFAIYVEVEPAKPALAENKGAPKARRSKAKTK
jgi:hypothetical protein